MIKTAIFLKEVLKDLTIKEIKEKFNILNVPFSADTATVLQQHTLSQPSSLSALQRLDPMTVVAMISAQRKTKLDYLSEQMLNSYADLHNKYDIDSDQFTHLVQYMHESQPMNSMIQQFENLFYENSNLDQTKAEDVFHQVRKASILHKSLSDSMWGSLIQGKLTPQLREMFDKDMNGEKLTEYIEKNFPIITKNTILENAGFKPHENAYTFRNVFPAYSRTHAQIILKSMANELLNLSAGDKVILDSDLADKLIQTISKKNDIGIRYFFVKNFKSQADKSHYEIQPFLGVVEDALHQLKESNLLEENISISNFIDLCLQYYDDKISDPEKYLDNDFSGALRFSSQKEAELIKNVIRKDFQLTCVPSQIPLPIPSGYEGNVSQFRIDFTIFADVLSYKNRGDVFVPHIAEQVLFVGEYYGLFDAQTELGENYRAKTAVKQNTETVFASILNSGVFSIFPESQAHGSWTEQVQKGLDKNNALYVPASGAKINIDQNSAIYQLKQWWDSNPQLHEEFRNTVSKYIDIENNSIQPNIYKDNKIQALFSTYRKGLEAKALSKVVENDKTNYTVERVQELNRLLEQSKPKTASPKEYIAYQKLKIEALQALNYYHEYKNRLLDTQFKWRLEKLSELEKMVLTHPGNINYTNLIKTLQGLVNVRTQEKTFSTFSGILLNEGETPQTGRTNSRSVAGQVAAQNTYVDPASQQLKNEFFESISASGSKVSEDIFRQAWSNFEDKMRYMPYVQVPGYPSFEEWRKEHTNEDVEKEYLESRGKNAIVDRYNSTDKSIPFEEFKTQFLDKKAKEMYNASQEYYYYAHKLNIPSSHQNTFEAVKQVRNLWTDALANFFIEKVPAINPNPNGQTVTIVTGFPGAGKSSIIESNQHQSNNPLRETKYGVLGDVDEFQKYIPGYAGGLGSARVFPYANSSAKKIIKNLLEKGHDVVIPEVGGDTSKVLDSIVEYVVKGYNVKVILVDTPKDESFNRVLSRAKDGGRMINFNFDSNPSQAYVQAQEFVKEGMQNPEVNNPAIAKIMKKMKLTPARLKSLPPESRKSLFNQYLSKVSFEKAQN